MNIPLHNPQRHKDINTIIFISPAFSIMINVRNAKLNLTRLDLGLLFVCSCIRLIVCVFHLCSVYVYTSLMCVQTCLSYIYTTEEIKILITSDSPRMPYTPSNNMNLIAISVSSAIRSSSSSRSSCSSRGEGAATADAFCFVYLQANSIWTMRLSI